MNGFGQSAKGVFGGAFGFLQPFSQNRCRLFQHIRIERRIRQQWRGVVHVQALLARLKRNRRGQRIGSQFVLGIFFDLTPAHDVFLMLVKCFGKNVPSGAIGHKVKLFGTGRIGHRFQRGAARICDRARRQTIHLIGVIRCHLVQFRTQNGVAQSAFSAHQAINDGRIGLQADVLVQAVDVDRRHAGALVGFGSLFFNDRGESHHLIRRFQRQIRRSLRPNLGNNLL